MAARIILQVLQGRSAIRLNRDFFSLELLYLVTGTVVKRRRPHDCAPAKPCGAAHSNTIVPVCPRLRRSRSCGNASGNHVRLTHRRVRSTDSQATSLGAPASENCERGVFGMNQGLSFSLAEFVHVVVQVGFWKYIASGAEQSLSRCVGLVVDSLVAGFEAFTVGRLGVLCSGDGFRERFVYRALIDHHFKATYTTLEDVFIHYSKRTVSGLSGAAEKAKVTSTPHVGNTAAAAALVFVSNGAKAPETTQKHKEETFTAPGMHVNLPTDSQKELDRQNSLSPAQDGHQSVHAQVVQRETRATPVHPLAHSHDTQNRYLTFGAWTTFLSDLGIVHIQAPEEHASRAPSIRTKQEVPNPAVLFPPTPMGRSRRFAYSAAASRTAQNNFACSVRKLDGPERPVSAENPTTGAIQGSEHAPRAYSDSANIDQAQCASVEGEMGDKVTLQAAAVAFDASCFITDTRPMCTCHRHSLDMASFLEALVRVAFAMKPGDKDLQRTVRSGTSRDKSSEEQEAVGIMRQDYLRARAWKLTCSTYFQEDGKDELLMQLDGQLHHVLQRIRVVASKLRK